MAAATVLCFFFSLAIWTAGGGHAAVVEHTFVVSQEHIRHPCKDTVMTVVNGQFPGPVIEVTEGDTVVVHVVNKSPHGITIHWHGVKQRLNCWNDGAGMITQCPIQPNNSFTYRFNVAGQEGTLWWHAHINCLRGTVHGALVIHPRGGPSAYPYPKPDKEVPIVIGEWWETDLVQFDKDMSTSSGNVDANPAAPTINGKIGDFYKCSGAVEDNYVLNVEHGKKYLLRIVNAALISEYYFKLAGHKLTVVAADANYVKPYTTDVIAIAPGETVDVLVVADATPGRYYMVALANQPPLPDPQIPMMLTRGIVQYKSDIAELDSSMKTPMLPEMPNQHNISLSFHFHGNLTGLLHPRRPLVPQHVDEHMFVTLGLGYICRSGAMFCNRSLAVDELIIVATMNNVSFELPKTTPLLEAHYQGKMSRVAKVRALPDKPPRVFNYTDPTLVPLGEKVERFEPSSKGKLVRRFRFNSTVEIVFQSTSQQQSDANPMHLHGHDFFVLAQGLGNFDPERDMKRYNLVDPPLRNTVHVPRLGWAVIRFVTDNPGVWYMHCHYEFHVSMGMAAAFEVDNGPTVDTTLPPPPADFPKCDQHTNVAYE